MLILLGCTNRDEEISSKIAYPEKLIGYWQRSNFGFYNTMKFKNDSIVTFDLPVGQFDKYKYKFNADTIIFINPEGILYKSNIVKMTPDTLVFKDLFQFEGFTIYCKINPDKMIEYSDGKMEALKDIENGILSVKTYGLPSSWAHEYQRIFDEKYGVKIEAIVGCIVTKKLMDYATDYNLISKAEIKKQFGDSVFSQVEKMARNSPNNYIVEDVINPPIDLDSLLKNLK